MARWVEEFAGRTGLLHDIHCAEALIVLVVIDVEEADVGAESWAHRADAVEGRGSRRQWRSDSGSSRGRRSDARRPSRREKEHWPAGGSGRPMSARLPRPLSKWAQAMQAPIPSASLLTWVVSRKSSASSMNAHVAFNCRSKVISPLAEREGRSERGPILRVPLVKCETVEEREQLPSTRLDAGSDGGDRIDALDMGFL